MTITEKQKQHIRIDPVYASNMQMGRNYHDKAILTSDPAASEKSKEYFDAAFLRSQFLLERGLV